METLFEGVAKHHGVSVALVRQYSLDRDAFADTATIIGFGILYVFAVYILTGRIRRHFPPGEPGFWIMTLTMAVGVAFVGVLTGSLWSIVIEWIRLNSGHLSFRMNRMPFRHHWVMLLICCFIVFVLVALIRSRVKLAPTNTRTRSQVSLH